MARWCVSLLVLAVAGCGHAMIDAQADKRVAASRAETNELYRSPTCDDGALLGPTCGSVVARARTREFRDSFRSQKCESAGADACDALLDEAIDRWVRQRYNLAVVSDVDQRCERVHGLCEDALEWENLMLSSHNEVLAGAARGRENAINERRAVLHAEETERQRKAAIAAAIVQANLSSQAAATRAQTGNRFQNRHDAYPYNPYRHHVVLAPRYVAPPIPKHLPSRR